MNLEKLIVTKDDMHATHLRTAYNFGMSCSEDSRTKVGAVLVAYNRILALGTNHFVSAHYKDVSGDEKYKYIIHAEVDAITKASKYWGATHRSTLYAPWFSCIECAKVIIGAGVTRIVGHKTIMEKSHPKWENNINTALDMLANSGVEMFLYDGTLNTKTLFQGNEYLV